jgi:hypothetical protein
MSTNLNFCSYIRSGSNQIASVNNMEVIGDKATIVEIQQYWFHVRTTSRFASLFLSLLVVCSLKCVLMKLIQVFLASFDYIFWH